MNIRFAVVTALLLNSAGLAEAQTVSPAGSYTDFSQYLLIGRQVVPTSVVALPSGAAQRGNVATVTQSGLANAATVVQDGVTNTAITMQVGNGNSSSLTATGDSNNLTSTQIGEFEQFRHLRSGQQQQLHQHPNRLRPVLRRVAGRKRQEHKRHAGPPLTA